MTAAWERIPGMVISNCPQMNNPVNDYKPTPVRAIVYQP